MAVFALVGLSLVAGFCLLALLALTDQKSRRAAKRTSFDRKEFDDFCVILVREGGLRIVEKNRTPERLDLVAKNPAPLFGGEYLVRGLYRESREPIPVAEILEFSESVSQEKVLKGVLITNGTFPPDLSTIGESKPIEFLEITPSSADKLRPSSPASRADRSSPSLEPQRGYTPRRRSTS